MKPPPDVKETIAELVENLGTVGAFMLSESRAFLRRSWGASREEFMAAVDQIARNMKQSGKMAVQDVETAAEKVKQSWEVLDRKRTWTGTAFWRKLSRACQPWRRSVMRASIWR